MNASSPRKVLVIDDESDVVDLMRELLGAQDYEAIATTQWMDAIDALAHQDPDLMLMDLNMPMIDGPRLLKFVREQGYEVPVIVVSGFISDDIRNTLEPLQVSAYVEKPFEIHELAHEVARVLKESDQAEASVNGEVAETGEDSESEASLTNVSVNESETTEQEAEIETNNTDSESEQKIPAPTPRPAPEVPVDTGPGVLAPRRTHRPHRSRKPMPSHEPSAFMLFLKKRVGHLFLIAILCLALAGIVVVMAERSDDASGQYVNPPAEVR